MSELIIEPGAKGKSWSAYSINNGANQPSASKAAAGAGKRNICRNVCISVETLGTAPTAATLTVRLRDGATGAGTILGEWQIRVPATANQHLAPICLNDLWIEGSENTAMTLEFSGNVGTNIQGGVFMAGEVE